MTTKKASEMIAGDRFYHHDEDVEGNHSRTTLTCAEDAAIRQDQFGIDRAVIGCEISDPVMVEGARLTASTRDALAKGHGAMIFGTDTELLLADAHSDIENKGQTSAR